MKAYKIKPIKIAFPFGEANVITVGQEGRGRRIVYVHAPENFTGSEPIEVASTRSGGVKLVHSKNYGTSNYWCAKISSAGTYTKRTGGAIYTNDMSAEVLAYGNGAYGDAGRNGSWLEILVKIKDGSMIRVEPIGGYKTDNYFLHFTETEVIRVEANQMEIHIEKNNLDVKPTDFGIFSEAFGKCSVLHPKTMAKHVSEESKARWYEQRQHFTWETNCYA